MLNVICVMGRLTADPEVKQTPNGVSVATFTIACERSYVKAGAQRETDFFDVVAWRGTGEFVGKFFRKGQLIAVNGSLQTRMYEDKNGNRRKVHEIVADNVHFAEAKNDKRPEAKSEKALDVDPNEFDVIESDDSLPF